MFSAAHATAERNNPLRLDFVFATGATPVHKFACCELYVLIQVLLPLKAALISAGAVTSPAPRDPMPDSKDEPRRCGPEDCRNGPYDD